MALLIFTKGALNSVLLLAVSSLRGLIVVYFACRRQMMLTALKALKDLNDYRALKDLNDYRALKALNDYRALKALKDLKVLNIPYQTTKMLK